jgi:uncharacterized protein YndB with AHSA1/START domain
VIHRSVLLACEPAAAFALFTERASEWWPPERRHTRGSRLSEIRLLPTGRFWERGEDGSEVELGRVRSWDPPRRLVIDFYVGTDAEHPTELVITFAPSAGGTQLTIDHRPTPTSEAIWRERADRFASSWELIGEALERTSLAHR